MKILNIIKFFIVSLLALFLFRDQLLATAAGSLSSNLPRGRAMWVWNNESIVTNMVNNVGEYRQELFDFCMNPHGNPDHRISVLFLDCNDAVYNYPDSLRRFLQATTENGLTVEYLDGAPSWATYNQEKGLERINRVLEFNAASLTNEEKLHGIQFDVEPYLLKSTSSYDPPYWDVDLDSVWTLYFNYIDSCQTIIDNTTDYLYFGIAIPRWYENYVGVEELGRLQSLTDYIAIMDYNENPSVIIRDAANEIINAAMYNKRVWIGVETKNVLPETVSFYDEGIEVMEEALTQVVAAYEDSSVFSGIAIHAYRYYKDFESTSANEEDEQKFIEPDQIKNYENPVKTGTTIEYSLPKSMKVEVVVYNMLGQVVDKLISVNQGKGINRVYWDASQYPSGIYLYQIKTDDFVKVRKMLVAH